MFSSFVEDDYPIIMPYIYPVCVFNVFIFYTLKELVAEIKGKLFK